MSRFRVIEADARFQASGHGVALDIIGDDPVAGRVEGNAMTAPATILHHVHHALGNPATPAKARQPDRDHFAITPGDALSADFTASPYFTLHIEAGEGRSLNVWKVTPAGREAMASALEQGWTR